MASISSKSLFVFDVDGTILPSFDGRVSEKTIKAIDYLLDKGHAVCIASGRPFVGIHAFLSLFHDGEKFAGIANGSMLSDYEGNLIWRKTLTESDLHYFAFKYQGNPDFEVYGYGVDDDVLYFEEGAYCDMEVRVNGMHSHRLKLGVDEGHSILKIMVATKTPEIARSLSLTEEEARLYRSTRSGPCYFEIIPLGTSKGICAEELRKYLGIDEENVYCFGDSENDLSMVSAFYGVALGNADEDVKKAAKFVAKTCAEDGVYYALKDHFGLPIEE